MEIKRETAVQSTMFFFISGLLCRSFSAGLLEKNIYIKCKRGEGNHNYSALYIIH